MVKGHGVKVALLATLPVITLALAYFGVCVFLNFTGEDAGR